MAPKLIPLECSTQGQHGPWWAYTKDEIVAVRKRDCVGLLDQTMIMTKDDTLDLGSGKIPRYIRISRATTNKPHPVVVMPKKQYLSEIEGKQNGPS